MRRWLILLFAWCLVAAPPRRGSVERVKVHGKSLEGNLAGDSPDRDVSIYLPPSYKTDPNRRYPVVYFLHGMADDDEKWFGLRPHWIDLPAVVEKALGNGLHEMIIVMPNAYTRFQGSAYSSSVVTGDWEGFIGRELVNFIDGHYRTIAAPESRGLAGHTMGGYGAIRIGMKHPRVFSSVYALSPCCLAPNMSLHQQPGSVARAVTVRNFEELEKADLSTKIVLAIAAAWSPNPKRPPLYIDLPWKDGQFQPMVAARWTANAPLAMLDQYIPNLKRLRGIAFDSGDKDAGLASSARLLDQSLTVYGVAHDFEIYPGTHVNNTASRIENKMLPFFSKNLSLNQARR